MNTDNKAMPRIKPGKANLVIVTLVLVGLSIMSARGTHWRDADRSSTGLAPLPEEHPGAVLQVYAARTFGWRGALAVHTWISIKHADADNYTVHQVLGWRARRNQSVVVSVPDLPDRLWYGKMPVVLVDMRGAEAAALIPRVEEVINDYPYADKYVMWPGPNSNTFTAYVGRQVPKLELDLPPTAIGKDYLVDSNFIASTPGGSGYQFSLFGLLGVSLGIDEGLEINVLGLNFGVNPVKLQLKLPGVGLVGRPSDTGG